MASQTVIDGTLYTKPLLLKQMAERIRNESSADSVLNDVLLQLIDKCQELENRIKFLECENSKNKAFMHREPRLYGSTDKSRILKDK